MNLSRHPCGGLLLLALPTALAAQGSLVVPPSFATAEAPGRTALGGMCADQRQQVLVNGTHLQPLLGRSITALWLRRDAQFGDPLAPQAADLVVRLSETPRDADDPANVLAQNHGPAVVQVFQGRVSLPAAPAVAGGPAPWDAQHAVALPFSTPFAYGGGNLCIDIEGRAVRSGTPCFWPFDAATSFHPGTVAHIGQPCGATPGPFNADADHGTLRIGSTALFRAWAQPDTPGVAMLAMQALPQPFDLTGLGATGCALYIYPDAVLPQFFGGTTLGIGITELTLQLPLNPTLMGGGFHVQFADLETGLPPSQWSNSLGLTTTNAVRATVSSRPPDLGMSMVTTAPVPAGQPFPGTGETDVSVAPVLRFDWQ